MKRLRRERSIDLFGDQGRMRSRVFSSDNLDVFHVPGDGDGPVFVTFQSFAGKRAADRGGFGEAYFARRGICAYHFIPRRNSWYQHTEMLEALTLVRAAIPANRPVFTYGSSMGGYAAYRFSGVLDAAKVIAFSPQYSNDPMRVPWERRWRDVAQCDVYLWDHLPASRSAETFLFYDPATADARHADIISRTANAVAVPLRHAGHTSIALLRDMELLDATLMDIYDDTFERAELLRAVELRAETSACFLSNRALALPYRSRARRVELLEKAIAFAPGEPLYHASLGYLFAIYGQWKEAEAAYLRALEIRPEFPIGLYHYLRLLQLLGRDEDAQRVADRLKVIEPELSSAVSLSRDPGPRWGSRTSAWWTRTHSVLKRLALTALPESRQILRS